MILQVQTMFALLEGRKEPTHPKPKSSFEHESSLVPKPCGLHYGKIWHVNVCSGNGRGIPVRWNCSQWPLAQNW